MHSRVIVAEDGGISALERRIRKKVWLSLIDSHGETCGMPARGTAWRDARQVRQIEGLIRSLLSDHGRVILHGHYVGSSHQALEATKGLDGRCCHSYRGTPREGWFGNLFKHAARIRKRFLVAVAWKAIQRYSLVLPQMVFPSAGALELFEEAVGQFNRMCAGRYCFPSGVSAKVQHLRALHGARNEASCLQWLLTSEKGVDRNAGRAVAKCRDVALNELKDCGCESVCTQDLMRAQRGIGGLHRKWCFSVASLMSRYLKKYFKQLYF